MNSRVLELQCKIDDGKRAQIELDQLQRFCNHQWGKSETTIRRFKKEEIDYTQGMIGRGSDPYYPTRFVDASEVVYVRTCPNCGKTETTTQTEPIILAISQTFNT
jgi:hypothetical protein